MQLQANLPIVLLVAPNAEAVILFQQPLKSVVAPQTLQEATSVGVVKIVSHVNVSECKINRSLLWSR